MDVLKVIILMADLVSRPCVQTPVAPAPREDLLNVHPNRDPRVLTRRSPKRALPRDPRAPNPRKDPNVLINFCKKNPININHYF